MDYSMGMEIVFLFFFLFFSSLNDRGTLKNVEYICITVSRIHYRHAIEADQKPLLSSTSLELDQDRAWRGGETVVDVEFLRRSLPGCLCTEGSPRHDEYIEYLREYPPVKFPSVHRWRTSGTSSRVPGGHLSRFPLFFLSNCLNDRSIFQIFRILFSRCSFKSFNPSIIQ